MVSFGSLAGPIVGGLLGGLGGSKGDKSTQTQKPYLPPEFEKAYLDPLLKDTLSVYKQPFPAGSKTTYNVPQDSPYYSPEIAALQNIARVKSLGGLLGGGAQSAPAQDDAAQSANMYRAIASAFLAGQDPEKPKTPLLQSYDVYSRNAPRLGIKQDSLLEALGKKLSSGNPRAGYGEEDPFASLFSGR